MRGAAIAGLAVWFIASSGCTTARRITDDQKDGDASLWIHTPHVSAGDTLELEIGAFDSPEVGVGSVTVSVNGEAVRTTSGAGMHWGSTITTSDRAVLWESVDWVLIELTVPHGVDSMTIRIEGVYFSAGDMGGSFMNFDEDMVFEVTVPVLSPAMKYARRALSLLVGLAVLGAVALALRRRWGSLDQWMQNRDGQLLVIGLIGWGLVGYAWFGTRVAIATGWTGTTSRVIAAVVWVAAPIAIAAIKPAPSAGDDGQSLPRARAR